MGAGSVSAAASLRASSDALFLAGQETSAIFARSLADQCDRMGPIGEALHRHWAADMAARAQRVQRGEAA